MGKNHKINIKKIILFAVIMLFAICVYGYVTFLSYNNGAITTIYEAGDNTKEYILLYDGETVTQEFTTDVSRIRGVTMRFSFKSEKLDNGVVNMTLQDVDSGEILAEASLSTMNLVSMGDNCFGFDSKLGVSGRKLLISMTTEGITKKQHFKLVTSDSEDDNEACIALGVIATGVDSFFIIQNVAFILLIISLAAMFIYFATGDRTKRPLEKIYLPVGLLMGLVFALVIPVASAPDEPVHMRIAYSLSNIILGVEGSSDSLVMRQCDGEYYFKSKGMSRTDYNNEYSGLFSKATETELISTGRAVNNTCEYLYVFSALGITLGRLLGVGTVLMYIMGRMFNVLVFSLAVYYAIRKIPFGKAVVFIWAVLPIMLQQTASYSYDCLINAMSILIIAITLNLRYGTVYEISKSESKDQKLPKWLRILLQPKVILLIICCILLIPCKSYALTPIVAFPLILLAQYIRNHKDKIKNIRNNIKPWVKRCLAVCGAVLVLAVVAAACLVLKRIMALPDEGNFVDWADSYSYSLGFWLRNPFQFVTLLVNTLFVKGDMYLNQMLGSSLGWFDINLPFVFVLPFFLMIIFAAMRKSNETQPIRIGEKIWMWILFVGVAALAAAGMLLNWTPVYLNYIEGVQGRYFLPALVLFLIPLRTKKACVGEDTDKIFVYIPMMMYLLILTSIFNCAG